MPCLRIFQHFSSKISHPFHLKDRCRLQRVAVLATVNVSQFLDDSVLDCFEGIIVGARGKELKLKENLRILDLKVIEN